MTTKPIQPAPGPPERLRCQPSWLVNHVGIPANRLVVERLGRPGARSDYAILAALAEFGPVSQATLGRRLGMDRSDVTGVLDSLQERGHVVRTVDPDDRRRNAVSITDSGRDALHLLDTELDAAQDALLAPLSQHEREQFVALLQRLVDHHTSRQSAGDGT
ncbi:MarR family winged helix-turn-helix transcriptional regulator [Plantactinospora sp. GCM10030261]|uniref:MarR family winged helix-turn-helix transcriptional regulator n=1 Tax=Plantactinospora sp. GCM10030261 TaxID=3273420 RepID=UPI0036093EAE